MNIQVGGKGMNPEKMKVLELLESGKISADEAGQLLETLGRGDHRPFIKKETRDTMEEKLHRFTKNVDQFAREVGCKMQSIYKDVEPKIKKASQAALEKAACVLDDAAKSMNEALENSKKAACDDSCCENDNNCCVEEDDDDNTPRPN